MPDMDRLGTPNREHLWKGVGAMIGAAVGVVGIGLAFVAAGMGFPAGGVLGLIVGIVLGYLAGGLLHLRLRH